MVVIVYLSFSSIDIFAVTNSVIDQQRDQQRIIDEFDVVKKTIFQSSYELHLSRLSKNQLRNYDLSSFAIIANQNHVNNIAEYDQLQKFNGGSLSLNAQNSSENQQTSSDQTNLYRNTDAFLEGSQDLEQLTPSDKKLDQYYYNQASKLKHTSDPFNSIYPFSHSQVKSLGISLGQSDLFDIVSMYYSVGFTKQRKLKWSVKTLEYNSSINQSISDSQAENNSGDQNTYNDHIGRLSMSVGFGQPSFARQTSNLAYDLFTKILSLNLNYQYYIKSLPIFSHIGLGGYYFNNIFQNVYVYQDQISESSTDMSSFVLTGDVGFGLSYLLKKKLILSINLLSVGYAKVVYVNSKNTNEQIINDYSLFLDGVHVLSPLNISIGYVFD